MRNLLFVFLTSGIVCSTFNMGHAQQGEWTWVNGDSTPNNYGIYGIKGVPDAANQPGGRLYATQWADASGNLWLYGGVGYAAWGGQVWMNDMWKYDVSTGEWAWINGDSIGDVLPTFGMKGVASANNQPGARYYSMTWTDYSGNLWLFGGYGTGGAFGGFMNDLWKYNIGSGEWTWVNGDTIPFVNSVFGRRGVASATNKPGQRKSSSTWTDLSGNLWLFGGDYYITSTGVSAWQNDLWEYKPTTNQWTWMSGDTTFNSVPVFGTKGVANDTNKPGGKSCAVSWTDLIGNLWLFSGRAPTLGYSAPPGTIARTNDLWKYNISTNQWAYMGGDTTQYSKGVYGTKGTPSANTLPGIRENATGWLDRSGNLWVFGGYGYPDITATGWLNDLWKFDITTGEWTWVSGDTVFGVYPVYGIEGLTSPINKPGSRSYALGWVDLTGKFWLFGGQGYSDETIGSLNDLWSYPPGTSLPAPVAAFTAAPDTICAGDTVHFTDLSTGSPVSWSWSFPGGVPDTSTAQNPIITYPQSGIYPVSLVVTNTGGSDTVIKTNYIVVRALPVPVVTATDTIICSGDSTQVCTTTTYASYLWNTSDTTHCTSATVASGYWLTVTDANGCSAISNHAEVSVYPVPSVSITVQGDTLSSFGQANYRWIKDGVSIDTATGAVYVAHQSGDYAVQVTDTNGCTTTSEAVTVTGLQDITMRGDVSVYPNPNSTGSWQLVVGNKLAGSELEVYDEEGRIVFHSIINNQKSAIQLEVPAGVYCLSISGPQVNIVKKLIKL